MSDRRRMLRLLLAGSASLGLPRATAAATPTEKDPEWLSSLASLDVASFLDVRSFVPDGSPFRKATNLLAALTTEHGFAANRVGLVLTFSSSALGHLMGPEGWTSYPIGELIAAELPPEHRASLLTDARRWGRSGAEGARALRARGSRLLACANTLRRWARDLAPASGESPDIVRERLQGALHPGVEVVPAAIAAAVLAQRRGVPYIAVG